ncbi:MAG: 1-deoxy-D-xylulose-5-phosphate reductoisomerase [Flavobacteriales bacterium]
MEAKGIAILGSTGSIGTQALEVLAEHPDAFRLEVLTAHSSSDTLIDQALLHRPDTVVIGQEDHYEKVSGALQDQGIKVFAGKDALDQVVEKESIDTVLTALVGYAGLSPTLAAIDAGKDIALSNKETLVVAGELVTNRAKKKGVKLVPVDSEHSAIYQCLMGERGNPVDKLYLTASGGPFRGMGRDNLKGATREEALDHPNWDMGAKITIDSATMMNKGLEVIEAHWLFGIPQERIEVVVHPQSIVHSMVRFADGIIKAELGEPDMKRPIRFALSYPLRIPTEQKGLEPFDLPNLSFEPTDMETFRNLAFAFQALRDGGNRPCVLNAANEVAVDAFLDRQLDFLGIQELIGECLERIEAVNSPGYEELVETDQETRRKAKELLKKGQRLYS